MSPRFFPAFILHRVECRFSKESQCHKSVPAEKGAVISLCSDSARRNKRIYLGDSRMREFWATKAANENEKSRRGERVTRPIDLDVSRGLTRRGQRSTKWRKIRGDREKSMRSPLRFAPVSWRSLPPSGYTLPCWERYGNCVGTYLT